MDGNIRKLIHRDNNVTCDVCGKKKKRSQTTLAYGSGDIPVIVSCLDGCADYRHPLNDAPPVIFDGQPVPDARPDVTNADLPFITNFTNPSYMKWGYLVNAGSWGKFNNPNNEFNTSGQWTWGNFKRV